MFARCIFPFSNTISVNFWFDPKNATTNDGVQDPEKSENNSAEALVEKSLENDKPHQDTKSPVAGSEQTTGEDLRDAGDDKQPKEHNDEVNKDQVKDDISEKEKKAETEGEKKATQEEEEGEIELSAAQYLALLRETESLLYQATLNHEKVGKQFVSGYKKTMLLLQRGKIIQLGSFVGVYAIERQTCARLGTSFAR